MRSGRGGTTGAGMLPSHSLRLGVEALAPLFWGKLSITSCNTADVPAET